MTAHKLLITNHQSLITDFLVVGAGIIGLSIARELSKKYSDSKIIVIEKESNVALHSSGRNSGVLHAGFYYTSDSLKAKFTRDGNKLLTDYCLQNELSINRCGKVVVAKDEHELKTIYELDKRGKANGVDVRIIDEKELSELEPNAKTFGKALYSPTTSSVDPKLVCRHIADSLKGNAQVLYDTFFIKRGGKDSIVTNNGKIKFKHLINTAGLYADKIAHQFGVGKKYTLIPFKGLYVKYNDDKLLRMHVYPVPNLKNPFLGVHYTKKFDGTVKVGPTSMPAFWRENYKLTEKFKCNEFVEVAFYESLMFMMKNDFRSLAFDEIKKYSKSYMVSQAFYMTKKVDPNNFGKYLEPGIRAQLVDKKSLELVMDFVVEHAENSTHVLNAVSPAFTAAPSFGKWVVEGVKE